jgi:hypothetical protein
LPSFGAPEGGEMRVIELNKKESVKEVTLERARELLKNKKIGDEELKKLMDNLRAFCRIVIDIHEKNEKEKKGTKQTELTELKIAA